MGKFGLFILLFAIATSILADPSPKPQCKFTSTNGFYSHVPSDLPIGDVIFRGTVTPSDAEMVIANVRSDVLKDLDWSDRLEIDQSTPGAYLLRLSSSLSLPVYPSPLQEANLFITVICNGYAYPLFTLHIDPTNRFGPQFYNEPYVITLPLDLPIGTVLESPVAAIDWDPRESYQMRFWLEDAHKGFILLEDSPRVTSKKLIPGSSTWQKEQLPTVVRIQVTGPYKLPLTLRVIAQDAGGRKSTTFINLLEKLTIGGTLKPTVVPYRTPTTSTTTTTELPEVILDSEVTTEKVTEASRASEAPEDVTEAPKAPKASEGVTEAPEDPKAPEDVPEAPESPQHDQKLISDLKKALSSLITSKKPADNEDSDFDAIAFASKTSQLNAIETEDTVDQIEAFGSSAPSRFAQCSMRIELMENSANGTEVAKLDVVNWRNDTKIRLIDPDDTFSIDNDTVIVNDSKLIDRELFSTLELVAEIENADPSVQCTRIRVYIDLDDENDNRPVFEHENYFFHISDRFPAGREIGKVLAQDIDQGSNGQITYHLLTPDVPFQVGTQGKWGVILSSAPLNSSISSFNLTVEARDHGEEVVKSARVPVEIFVLGAADKSDKKSDKVKVNGVKTVTTTTEAPESEESENLEDSDDVEVVTIIVEEEVEEEEDSEASEASESTTTTAKAPEDVTEAPEAPEDVTEAPEAPESPEDVTEASEAPRTTTIGQIQNSLESQESEDPEDPEDSESPQQFSFRQPEYSYSAFGMEIQENDVIGKVEAHPNPEFYAVDREVIGFIKINEIGEILAGRKLNRHTDGPLTFGVSATNGFETNPLIREQSLPERGTP